MLFDLDGTLVDSERGNVESVVLALRRYGTELIDEERGFVIGHSWNEIYAMIVRNHALAVGMHELIAAAVAEKEALVAKTGYRPLPGSVALVRRLAGKVEAGRGLGRQRKSRWSTRSGASAFTICFPSCSPPRTTRTASPRPSRTSPRLAQLGVARRGGAWSSRMRRRASSRPAPLGCA